MAVFLGEVLASMLEPFTLCGCVLAGSLLGKFWQSLVAATLWGLVVQNWIIKPRVILQQWEYRPEMLYAALLAAWLTTALVFYLANRDPQNHKT